MDDNFFEVEEPTPLLPEQGQTDNPPEIDREPAGPRPPSRRKRLTQIGLVLVAGVVVAALFRSIAAPASPTAPGVFEFAPGRISSPQTTLISSNINFGTVFINGQRQHGSPPMFFTSQDNTTYKIAIDAPPFLSKACVFSFINGAPESSDSAGCTTSTGGLPSITANGTTATPANIVQIDFTPDDLPPDQQSQINAILARSVSAQQTITVPAGSYIATHLNANGIITSRRVGAPVKATAFLAASDHFGLFGVGNCVGLICQAGVDLFWGNPPPAGNVWVTGVSVALRWRFTTSAGAMLGDVSFPAADVATALLAYSPGAGWSLTSQDDFGSFNDPSTFGNLDCLTGSQVAFQQLEGTNFSYSTEGGQGVKGCKMAVQDIGGSGRGSLIWRFGVLLAADAAAHKLLPRLPIAPQAEIAAVQG